jgi:hypothetical protein
MSKTWETQNGDEIEYGKLEDSHLLNILKWIKRQAKNGVTASCRGYDGDDDYITETTWEVFGKEVLNHFDYAGLLKEAKKRKLIMKLKPTDTKHTEPTEEKK